MDFMNRHFTATGLIIKNDSVLLHLHPKIHLWLPPGGHVELNEDPIETVKREILEETGYKIQIINTSNTHIKKFKNVISISLANFKLPIFFKKPLLLGCI